MKTYTVEFKNPTHKDIAKRIIIEEGGKIVQGFKCYCYYCLEYIATERQDAKIVKRLEYIGLLMYNFTARIFEYNYNITLERAMKILEEGEPWTIGTEKGQMWLFYFDGKELHNGSRIPLETLLKRECVEIYNRPERKRIFPEHKFMELEEGLAFIVSGGDNGEI